MTKVRNVFMSAGDFPEEKCFHTQIEYAQDKDLNEPAKQYIDDMKSNALTQIDPMCPDVNDFFKIVEIFKHLLKNGCRPHKDAGNYLEDGIWEIKKFTARITYFDVDSNGKHLPKNWNEDISDAISSETFQDLWYPNLDEVLRLATGFTKATKRTLPKQIRRAKQVRREDLAHG